MNPSTCGSVPAINCTDADMTPIYIPNFVPFPEPEDVHQLWEDMPWEIRTEARRECFFNLRETEYTYGSGAGQRTYKPVDLARMPALVEFAWELVHDRYNQTFEACFINGYADQHQHLGWHADDANMIDHSLPIVVVSFGAEREIWTRPYETHQGEPSAGVLKYRLGDCSLFEMPPGFQYTHQHRIPKNDRPCGKRVSLTFRALK